MTSLYFVMVALPQDENGDTPIHMFIEEGPRVRDKDIVAERQAIRDIHQIMADLIRVNITSDKSRLLRDGCIPLDGEPICSFAISCQYDPERGIPHYKGVDLIWITKNLRKYSRVPAVAREVYDMTFSTLRKREKLEMKAQNAPKWVFDRDDFRKTVTNFTEYCATITGKIAHKKMIHDTNEKRQCCKCRREQQEISFCSPPNFGCPCYSNGRCVAAK